MDCSLEQQRTENWLSQNAVAYAGLRGEVKIAVAHFVLVWGLLDFKHLGAAARRADVVAFGESEAFPAAPIDGFDDHIEYFKSRYLEGTRRNNRLDALAWNDYHSRERIHSGLVSASPDARLTNAVLLLITYRLRCNLVHGAKWESGLNDQLENLLRATDIVKKIMDNTG